MILSRFPTLGLPGMECFLPGPAWEGGSSGQERAASQKQAMSAGVPFAEVERELDLPEDEFTYLAGGKDRPYSHFFGRWKAIKQPLAAMLRACGNDRPLRVIDLGSCNGFFALQMAHFHPEADVVAVEGSIGIGNGTAGSVENERLRARQILKTSAVQTHLRWIQKLGLPNCFVAPEVWDYARVCDLASTGRPICDAMLMLSVFHHIDNISAQQYADAGMSKREGAIALLGKLLLLSPRHFVELPNRPWMAELFDRYGTATGILEAAAEASGRSWTFTGPIFKAEWFGTREVWILEVADPMKELDIRSCPFPLLYRGNEPEVQPYDVFDGLGSIVDYLDDLDGVAAVKSGGGASSAAGAAPGRQQSYASSSATGRFDFALPAAGGLADSPPLGHAEQDWSMGAFEQKDKGLLMDPALFTLASEKVPPVEDKIGRALAAAPTSLLIAHLTLREAIKEAQDALDQVRNSGLLDEGQQVVRLPSGSSIPLQRILPDIGTIGLSPGDGAAAPRGPMHKS